VNTSKARKNSHYTSVEVHPKDQQQQAHHIILSRTTIVLETVLIETRKLSVSRNSTGFLPTWNAIFYECFSSITDWSYRPQVKTRRKQRDHSKFICILFTFESFENHTTTRYALTRDNIYNFLKCRYLPHRTTKIMLHAQDFVYYFVLYQL